MWNALAGGTPPFVPPRGGIKGGVPFLRGFSGTTLFAGAHPCLLHRGFAKAQAARQSRLCRALGGKRRPCFACKDSDNPAPIMIYYAGHAWFLGRGSSAATTARSSPGAMAPVAKLSVTKAPSASKRAVTASGEIAINMPQTNNAACVFASVAQGTRTPERAVSAAWRMPLTEMAAIAAQPAPTRPKRGISARFAHTLTAARPMLLAVTPGRAAQRDQRLAHEPREHGHAHRRQQQSKRGRARNVFAREKQAYRPFLYQHQRKDGGVAEERDQGHRLSEQFRGLVVPALGRHRTTRWADTARATRRESARARGGSRLIIS